MYNARIIARNIKFKVAPCVQPSVTRNISVVRYSGPQALNDFQAANLISFLCENVKFIVRYRYNTITIR